MTDVIAHHAESPVWWPRLDVLRCVDLFAGDILTIDFADATITRTSVGSSVAACLRPRAGGGAIVATERGLALAARDDLSDLAAWREVFADARQRFNDGACDPDGRFYAGTTGYEGEPGIGFLYRVGSESSGPLPVVFDLTTSNGLAWSQDGTTVYLNDTGLNRTLVFDYDRTYGLTGRRTLLSFEDAPGRPDGLCVDSEGGLWIALNGAGLVRRYTPEGELTFEVEVPAPNVTACAFGGPDRRTLFITTSRKGVPGEEDASGSVFAADPGVRGREVYEFRGTSPRHLI